MNKALKRVSLALVGLGAIGGLFGGSTLPAAAQTIQSNPNQALPGLGSSDQSTDPLTGADGVNLYDIMHRLQMGSIPSMSEFSQQQQRTINSAASDFRTQQLERLRQQNPQTPTPQTAPVQSSSPSGVIAQPSAQPSINSLP